MQEDNQAIIQQLQHNLNMLVQPQHTLEEILELTIAELLQEDSQAILLEE